jgi:hypothetical protein
MVTVLPPARTKRIRQELPDLLRGVAFRTRGSRTGGGTVRKLVGVIAGAVMFAALSSGSAVAVDSTKTPGATNPAVTQATIGTTICRSGYTKTVRNVSTRTKHAVYVAYGISLSVQRKYVIDHLIPLEVGGGNDVKNLWPEPKAEAKTKDKLEGQMHTAVCTGSLTLTDAQARFLIVSAPPATAAPATEPPATEPPATEPPATAPPATEPPPAPAPSPQVVHPGAFCAPAGATGITTAGTAMVCGPASDGRNRWHAA